MDLLIALALILSLLSMVVFSLWNIEEELIGPPPRWMRNDCEDEDHSRMSLRNRS
jgi:hypothetical protein